MAPQLTASTALAVYAGSQHPHWAADNAYNSSYRGSDALFWPSQALHTCNTNSRRHRLVTHKNK